MSDLTDVFAELRQLLQRHAATLVVVRDEADDVQLATAKAGPSGTPMPFGAVQALTEHVSFQLMPVYSHPDLLDDVSEPLRARMQGKARFEFTPETITPELVAELSALVDAGLARYRADRLA
ncbi:MAG: hypothetical protein ACRDLN_17645 [Solirubrobacteraceae bacterium]